MAEEINISLAGFLEQFPEVKLPNTHIRVNMPLFRVVQYRHENQNKGKGIWPDIYISTSYEALKKGYDMKMKVVKEMILHSNKQR